jgi:hypothetical protein
MNELAKLGQPIEARKWSNRALITYQTIANSLASAGLTLNNSAEYREL